MVYSMETTRPQADFSLSSPVLTGDHGRSRHEACALRQTTPVRPARDDTHGEHASMHHNALFHASPANHTCFSTRSARYVGSSAWGVAIQRCIVRECSLQKACHGHGARARHTLHGMCTDDAHGCRTLSTAATRLLQHHLCAAFNVEARESPSSLDP